METSELSGMNDRHVEPRNIREMKARVAGRVQGRVLRGLDGRRHDRVKRRERKQMAELFLYYRSKGLDDSDAVRHVAKDMRRSIDTVKKQHLGLLSRDDEMKKPTGTQNESVREGAQASNLREVAELLDAVRSAVEAYDAYERCFDKLP